MANYSKTTGEWKKYSASDVLASEYVEQIIYVWIIYHRSEDGVTVYDKKMDRTAGEAIFRI